MSQPPNLLQLADEYANACTRSHGEGERKRLQAAILVSELEALEAQKRYDALLDEAASLRDRLSATTQSRDHWQTQHLNAVLDVAKHSPTPLVVIANPGDDLVVQMAARAATQAAKDEATRVCDSRSRSLSLSNKHSEANEAHKCGTAIGGRRVADMSATERMSDREWSALPANLREGCTTHVSGVGDL